MTVMTAKQVIAKAEKSYRQSKNCDGNYSFAIAATIAMLVRQGKVVREDAIAAIESMDLPPAVSAREIAVIKGE